MNSIETDKVCKLICEIKDKAKEKGYDLYRGEPNSEYPSVSPSLCRKLLSFGHEKFGPDNEEFNLGLDWFYPSQFQETITERAMTHLERDDERRIIIDIQHQGGISFLIDFTNDLYIALFFACNKLASKNGRVILAKKLNYSQDQLFVPPDSHGRGKSQSSVLICPEKGAMDESEYEEIEIPQEYKLPILMYLRDRGISVKKVYPDIQGFIDAEKSYWDAFAKKLAGGQAWAMGYTYQAIKFYKEATDIKTDYKEAYHALNSIYLTRAHRSRFPRKEIAKAEENLVAVQSFNPYCTFMGSFNPDPACDSGLTIREAELNSGDSFDYLWLDGEIRDVMFKYGELDVESEQEWGRMRADDHNKVIKWLSARDLIGKLIPNKTINLRSGHVVVCYDSGMLYLCLGLPRGKSQFVPAIKFLNTAICRIPDFIFAYALRAKIYKAMNKNSDANRDIVVANKINRRKRYPIPVDYLRSFISDPLPEYPKWIYDTPWEGSYSQTLYAPRDTENLPFWLYAESSEPIKGDLDT